MKIIGITGSPRGDKSVTKKLAERALDGARDNGASVEHAEIAKMNIGCCNACLTCYKTGRCPQHDDFNALFDKVLAADGIIIGTPVYFNHVSAQTKVFIDRTSDCRHCMYLEGKYGMTIVTTGYTGLEETSAYINEYLCLSGASVIGGVKAMMTSLPRNVEAACEQAYNMGKDLALAIRERRPYPDQEALRARFIDMFKPVVIAKKSEWISEYTHYKNRGWIRA